MICEHKRESRSAPASTPLPLPSLGTCLESSWLWLCAGFPLRRLWAYPGQTISGAAVDKCGVFAAALLHSRLAAAAASAGSGSGSGSGSPSFLSTSLSSFCHCPFFNCVCRDFTARCAFDSRQSLSLYPLPDPGEGSPKGTHEIGKVITLS